MIIELWDRAGTERLSTLTPDSPDETYAYSDLEYGSNRWGYATCTFTVRRDPSMYWVDLEDSNRVVVLHKGSTVWEGDIEGVNRQIGTDEPHRVECVGPSAKLKIQGTDADYDLTLEAGEKLSPYIVDHITSDDDLPIEQGDISDKDFEITTGIEFFPGKSYEDAINAGNEYNGWRPACWGWALDFKPRDETPKYYVHLEDCEQSELNRNRTEIYNWCQWAYTGDGSVYGYVTSEDTDSQERHGKRCYWGSVSGKCGETEAQEIADTFIAQHKDLRPSSSLTTDKVHDRYGGRIDPEEAKADGVIYVERLLSTEETIAGDGVTNETTTWEIAEVSYKDGKVTFSPGEPPDTVAVLLAQIENRSNY